MLPRSAAWATAAWAVAMAAQAIGYGILWMQPSLAGGITGMFVNNFGCGISLPLVLAFSMSRLPEGYRGRASGIWTSMFFIGQFVCPFAVGAASSFGGGMVAAMGVFCGFTAVAALLLLGFGRALREPATTGTPVVATH